MGRKQERERPAIAAKKKDQSPRALLALIEKSLADDKAVDVVAIDLAGKTLIADYMVVASGTSHRHVGAMSEHLAQRLKSVGVAPLSVEGAAQCDWVLVDGRDVIVHLFRPEVRAFYNLEKMWSVDLATDAERAAG